jgi:alanyl-tRNA synthetase
LATGAWVITLKKISFLGSLNLLLRKLALSVENIYVTAFSGDEEYDLPKDEASANLWQGLFKSKDIDAEIVHIGSEEDGYKRGMKPNERIFYYDSSKNWWAPEGEPSKMSVGQPGGPDSEVFYYLTKSSTTLNGASTAIRTVIVVGLWKSATLYSWNISAQNLALKNFRNKMSIWWRLRANSCCKD